MMHQRLIVYVVPLLSLFFLEGCVLDQFKRSSSPAPVTSSAPAMGQPSIAITAQTGDTLETIAKRYDVSKKALIKLNHLSPPYALSTGQGLLLPPRHVHIVRPFETLDNIAQKRGVDREALIRLNRLKPPYSLQPNQKLKLSSPFDGPGFEDDTLRSSTSQTMTFPSKEESLIKDETKGEAIERSEKLARLEKLSRDLEQMKKEREERRLEKKRLEEEKAADKESAQKAKQEESQEAEGPQAQKLTLLKPSKAGKSEGNGSDTQDVPQESEAPAVSDDTELTPSDEGTGETQPAQQAQQQPKAEQPQESSEAQRQPADDAAPQEGAHEASQESEVRPPVVEETGPIKHFAWPLRGEVVGKFGRRSGGLRNDGINIEAAKGAPIHAAESGQVVYVGNALKGFGNLILIRHREGWITTYAHCDQTFVKKGDAVGKGQKIASVGTTGSVKTPQLHFEVRKKTQTVDPLEYLK